MISGDLFPSYLLQILGVLLALTASFLTDEAGLLNTQDERGVLLALAFICSSTAWYIAIRHANRWLKLWKGLGD